MRIFCEFFKLKDNILTIQIEIEQSKNLSKGYINSFNNNHSRFDKQKAI